MAENSQADALREFVRAVTDLADDSSAVNVARYLRASDALDEERPAAASEELEAA